MQALTQLEEQEQFFDGNAFASMHNGSSKKHGLDKQEKKAAKQYRSARKNKRLFN